MNSTLPQQYSPGGFAAGLTASLTGGRFFFPFLHSLLLNRSPQAPRAVYVLQNLTEAGYLQAKEWEVVNFAWEQYRAALEGRAPHEPRTLVDVVREITSVMEGEFRADSVFEQVQRYLPMLKSKPHRASITSALNHLVLKGELKKTSESGRGKAAKYATPTVIEALLKELQESPGTEES